MTIELTLTSELAARLQQEAQRCQLSLEAVTVHLLEQSLPPVDERRAAALALLQQWIDEDSAADDAATGDTTANAEEFFQGLDAAQPSNRRLFPAELRGVAW